MASLRRNEDAESVSLAWDQPAPAAIEREPGDRRTPPAAERIFARLAVPWDRQISALEAAAEELRDVVRATERLHQLDGQILRAQNTEQLAKLDLTDLAKRRAHAISRAVTEVPDQPRLTRKRRVEEAKEAAAVLQDQLLDRTKRLTTTRLNTAMREQRRLLDEKARLLANPLVSDPRGMDLVAQLAAAVNATLTRDRAAREEALGDWARLRGTDERLQARLRARPNSVVLPGQAFGEGPIHLVADQRLALIELRRGRDGVRTEEVDGDIRLVQVLPDIDRPVGLTDGSTRHLIQAARAVEAAIGLAPAPVVCLSAWTGPAVEVAEVWLCGPGTITQLLEALDETPISRDLLRQAARALAMLPVPEPEADDVASLEHLTTIQPEEVPDGIPAVRDLIVLAHERRAAAY